MSMTATPRAPRPIASHSLRRGHWPSAPLQSAVASGMTLMSATVAPELTQRSATATPPFPATSSKKPTSAAFRHWFSVGIRCARSSCAIIRTPPATMKRVPTRKKGATSATPTLIAKYVVPHITYTASRQAPIIQGEVLCAAVVADMAAPYLTHLG
jgi:hypothetical protein